MVRILSILFSIVFFSSHTPLQRYNEIVQKKRTQIDLSTDDVRSIYTSTYENPVASLEAVDKYDPDGQVGFCFGRAMAAHLTALVKGAKPENIKKLFIIGYLSQTPNFKIPEWRFHVTTIVRAKDKKWYAIDPVAGRVLQAGHWIQFVRDTWDSWQGQKDKYQAYIYAVDTDVVLPDIRTVNAPTDEKGDLIIEKAFVPEKNGLKADANFAKELEIPAGYKSVYVLNRRQSEKFFIAANESESSERFDFEEIRINEDGHYLYNHYFADLFDTFESKESSSAAEFMTSTVRKPRTVFSFRHLSH